MTAATETFRVRHAVDDDRPFIEDAWLMSAKGVSYARTGGQRYMRSQKAVIRALLGVSDVRVACLHDDPDTIAGFIVTRPGLIRYVFVKRDLRKLGVARMLVDAFLAQQVDVHDVLYTGTLRWRLRLPESWVYDPLQDILDLVEGP